MESFFPPASPEEQGISPEAVSTMLDEIERRELEVTSMQLVVSGRQVLRFCKKPYLLDVPQLWFSVTKAFTGIGVGIARDMGYVGLDDPVISYFPDKLPDPVPGPLNRLRIRHLLSMTSGIHDNTYPQLYPQRDWVRAFLAQDFPHEPGSFYRYSTHASHLLAAIVERAVEGSFRDFLWEHLLQPLGVDTMTWETCSQGITAGGMGLGLPLEAVTRFGVLLLQGGVFNGKRLVSRDYLELATREQSDNRVMEPGLHKNGYGFHLFLDHGGDFYHGGAFGQLCYVSPGRNAILAATSRKNNWDDVIDLFHSLWEKPDGGEIPSHSALERRLAAMAYPLPRQRPLPADFPLPEGSYRLEENSLDLLRLVIRRDGPNTLHLDLEYANRPPGGLDFSFAIPCRGWDYFVKDIQIHRQRYVSYAAWQKGAEELTVFYIETPYQVAWRIRPSREGEIAVRYHVNASFGVKECLTRGRLEKPGPSR